MAEADRAAIVPDFFSRARPVAIACRALTLPHGKVTWIRRIWLLDGHEPNDANSADRIDGADAERLNGFCCDDADAVTRSP